MTYHQVSEENISKVESFFVQKAKETGSKKVEVTVIEIAERQNLSTIMEGTNPIKAIGNDR